MMEINLFLRNDDQKTDYCTDISYRNLVDYAFEQADYFMLVYVNYYGKGYSQRSRYFKKALSKFKVKKRRNPSWPGTLGTYCPNTEYQVIFYRTAPEAKQILKEMSKLSDWSRPSHPEDLAFFKGNQCWFYSVGHEKIAAFLHATKQDLAFAEANGLKTDAEPYDSWFDNFDEELC